MAVIAGAMADTRAAFDSVARAYGASNDANPLLCEMRARTLSAVFAQVPPGAHILDLGCGPGPDDELLGRSGYRVTALDWSAEMVAQARDRVARRGLSHRVTVEHLGIHELDRLDGGPFDAALSNFGPLNCVEAIENAAVLVAARLRPGGVLIASVIGRLCPWEAALYISRGEIARARLRLRRGLVPVPLNGRTVWMRYYTPSEFEAPFARAGFTRVSLQALGLFSPPPYLEAFAGRHPLLVRRLQRLDERVGGVWPFRLFGDHFLLVLRRG